MQNFKLTGEIIESKISLQKRLDNSAGVFGNLTVCLEEGRPPLHLSLIYADKNKEDGILLHDALKKALNSSTSVTITFDSKSETEKLTK